METNLLLVVELSFPPISGIHPCLTLKVAVVRTGGNQGGALLDSIFGLLGLLLRPSPVQEVFCTIIWMKEGMFQLSIKQFWKACD
ncbi:uncharacterized protein EDB91DRAFT_1246349 [Suillus paluster]|uniref:uncharacterized protein n=1 Tax=Suillus paluster TaxID=48578 RepID=UPI001B88715F|nr:uncharacterized protein EDB91DRAFT_1246349 [Suillus paluster]KAG1745475.1 hypothetical protein EDB91DRAFT_1246349 [Suillus paluster]